MPRRRHWGDWAWLLAVLVSLRSEGAVAQSLITMGSPAEDRLSTALLVGQRTGSAFLLRSPGALASEAFRTARSSGEAKAVRFLAVLPEVLAVWNSDLPLSLNDGSLWAGRGLNYRVMAGGILDLGPVSLVLAPEITLSQNLPYEVSPSTDPTRSPYASPFHTGMRSLDLPTRFGNETFARWEPGQSSLTLRLGKLGVGAASENMWWGPGIRNALVLSSHAPGFPHVFLRTEEALGTPFGDVQFRWISGALTESLYFDGEEANDLRSISAAALTLNPKPIPTLTLGMTRAVVAPVEGPGELGRHAGDAFLRWERRREAPDRPPTSDPLLSWFAQWRFPESGVGIWAEWARMDAPRSLEDLLTTPQRTQGYLLGLEWMRDLGGNGRRFRAQTEVVTLEQTRNTRTDPFPLDFYSGQAAPQGHTHRGQVLGASIGPGSSGQWLALDLLDPLWRAGVFLERIRWHNDALYREPNPNFRRHDVSFRIGARGGVQVPWADVFVEISRQERFNYLFQNGFANPGGFRTVDVQSYTVALRVTPRGRL